MVFRIHSVRDRPNYSNYWGVVHGVVMFVGWAMFAALAILSSSRKENSFLGKKWFVFHFMFSIATLACTVAGSIIIAYYFGKSFFFPIFFRFFFVWCMKSFFVEWRFFPLTDAHHYLGFFVIIVSGIQGLFGLIIHFTYNPNRYRLRFYLGRITFACAIIFLACDS